MYIYREIYRHVYTYMYIHTCEGFSSSAQVSLAASRAGPRRRRAASAYLSMRTGI